MSRITGGKKITTCCPRQDRTVKKTSCTVSTTEKGTVPLVINLIAVYLMSQCTSSTSNEREDYKVAGSVMITANGLQKK